MSADRLDGVVRATGLETATGIGAAKGREHRGHEALIAAHREDQNMLGCIHAFNNRVFRSIAINASSTNCKRCPTMGCCATKTKSTGWAKSCWCKRNTSRNNLLARARTTALPSRLVVMIPRRITAPGGNNRQFAIKQPHDNRRPSRRTRAKSRACLIRISRPKRRRVGGSVPAMSRLLKPGSNACGPRGGGLPGWRGRFWWNCDSKIHAAACGEFSTVDIVVS
jgi:hypothetical protein